MPSNGHVIQNDWRFLDMKSKKLETHIITEKSVDKNKKAEVRLDEKRCLTIAEFMVYCGVGRNNAFKLAEKANAKIKVGKKILVDRVLFDEWLEEQEKYNDGKLL